MSSYLAPRIIPAALPDNLPIFPLAGAVLFPHARLPLNIFEPRYLAMIEDALGQGRLVGMVQPCGDETIALPRLYSVGCAGRITSFNETDDGRLLIVITGLCRFRVASEQTPGGVYRNIRPDWKPYLMDMEEAAAAPFDRERLLSLAKSFFKKHAISVDWNLIKGAPDEILLPTIIMICPLASNEKQALLEADTFASRVEMLTTLLEMAATPQSDAAAELKH